jgi:hypothetical protein
MTVLIGLNGRRGAGKDTAYSFIHEWCEERGVSVGRRGFADALKLSFARIFLPDASVDEAVIWCDELKQDSKLTIEWGRGKPVFTTVNHSVTGRVALQHYGTEAHRGVFGDDFWVDVLLPLSTIIDQHDLPAGPQWPHNFMGQLDQEPPQICVITDCRFENEAGRIKKLDGQIWEVYRGAQDHRDPHASETPLPIGMIDKTLYNNAEGDYGMFRHAIRSAMEELKL